MVAPVASWGLGRVAVCEHNDAVDRDQVPLNGAARAAADVPIVLDFEAASTAAGCIVPISASYPSGSPGQSLTWTNALAPNAAECHDEVDIPSSVVPLLHGKVAVTADSSMCMVAKAPAGSTSVVQLVGLSAATLTTKA